MVFKFTLISAVFILYQTLASEQAAGDGGPSTKFQAKPIDKQVVYALKTFSFYGLGFAILFYFV